jgi:hypothetical protein
MGIEAFGVSMRLVGPPTHRLVRNYLETDPQIHFDQEDRTASYGAMVGKFFDGHHIIELQILREIATGNCTLSARFSLCSYDSIDPVFVGLVGRVLSEFPAEVSLMTSILKERPSYGAEESQALLAALPMEIASMRAYWQNLFGNKQGIVSPDDSFSFVGATSP